MRIEPPADFAIVEPKPAATVILLRPGTRTPFEVLLQQRHGSMAFMPNILVFPGGRMDKADAAPALLERTKGIAGLSPERAALVVAALRETFEESGVLLARKPGSASFVEPARVAALSSVRAQLNSKALTFAEFVEAEDLELAGDLIHPFSRWITPWWNKYRYDTYFFVVEAPAEQDAAHDGGEAVESLWLPLSADAIEEASAAGRLHPPTLRSLTRLIELGSLPKIFALDPAAVFEPINPWIEQRAGEFFLNYCLSANAPPEALPVHELSHFGFSRELAAAMGADLKAHGYKS